jgi:Domain of unknown function (DUF4124)
MRRLPLVLALLLLAPMASAQVYKWTDAHGTVHYSETPPPQGTPFKRITPTGGEQTPPPPPAQREDTTETREPGAAPMADTPENRAKLCESLKANLDLLKGKGAVVMEKDGKPVALDDTQRTQQIDDAQKQYQQYCGQ